jgi:hypothetical protein
MLKGQLCSVTESGKQCGKGNICISGIRWQKMKRGTNGNNAPDTILTIAKYEIKTQIKQRPDVCRKARKL